MSAILALSTPARILTGLAFLAVILLLRVLGRFLIRAGSAMEREKHGPLPGVTEQPRPRGKSGPGGASAEPERYDPFNAG